MKRMTVAAVLVFLLTLVAGGLATAGNLPVDSRSAPVQVFTPVPGFSENQSINTGASYTLTLAGQRVIRFYASGELKVKLNSNTAYMRSYGDIIGISGGVTQIVFANDSGSTVTLDIEGM